MTPVGDDKCCLRFEPLFEEGGEGLILMPNLHIDEKENLPCRSTAAAATTTITVILCCWSEQIVRRFLTFHEFNFEIKRLTAAAAVAAPLFDLSS